MFNIQAYSNRNFPIIERTLEGELQTKSQGRRGDPEKAIPKASTTPGLNFTS